MGRYCTTGNPDYGIFSRFISEFNPIINTDIAMNGVDPGKMYSSVNYKAYPSKQIPHGFLFDVPEPAKPNFNRTNQFKRSINEIKVKYNYNRSGLSIVQCRF